MKSKNSVMQENSELLKRSEISVNNFTEDVYELIVDKFRNDENFTSQMFNEKNENKAKIHKT